MSEGMIVDGFTEKGELALIKSGFVDAISLHTNERGFVKKLEIPWWYRTGDKDSTEVFISEDAAIHAPVQILSKGCRRSTVMLIANYKDWIERVKEVGVDGLTKDCFTYRLPDSYYLMED